MQIDLLTHGRVHSCCSSFTRYEKTSAEFVTRLPPGKHSTKGIGQTMPNPQGSKTTDSGAVIPMGKSMPANVKKSSLLYNEYLFRIKLRVIILLLFAVMGGR